MVVALAVTACSAEKGRQKHVGKTTASKPSKPDTTDYEGEELEKPKPPAAPQAPAVPAPTAPEPGVPANPTPENPATPVEPAPTAPVAPTAPITTPVAPGVPPTAPTAPTVPPVQNPDPFPTQPAPASPNTPAAPVKPEQPILPPSESLFPEEPRPTQPSVPTRPTPPSKPPVVQPPVEPPTRPPVRPQPAPNVPQVPEQPRPPVANPTLPSGWNPVHWEEKTAAGKSWSRITVGIIRTKARGLYKGASDMAMFCPNYANLSMTQRENVWVAIFSAIAYFESSYNPNTYAVESRKSFPKLDSVTGKPVASEGLLQLSYQDKKSYPKYCGEFNWDHDEELGEKDPRKTILNPRINLSCGIQIMHHKVMKTNRIAESERPYWAVIDPDHKHSRLDRIVGMVSGLPICKSR